MSNTNTDFFGGDKTASVDLGPRLSAIESTPISGDVCISIKGDNTITTFPVSSYGKSLLNVASLNGLINLINQQDSEVKVEDAGAGVINFKVDNEIIATMNVNGLTMASNKNLYAHTILSSTGAVQFFSDIKPVISTLNFGSNTQRWNNIFSSITDTNTLTSTGNGDINVNVNLVTNGLYIGGDILPYTGGMPVVPQNIGSIVLPFQDVYANDLHGTLHTNRIYNTNVATDYLDYNVLRDGITSYHYLRAAYGDVFTNVNNLFIASSGLNGIVFLGNTDNGVDTEYMRNWYDGGYIYGARLANRLLDVECRNIVPTTASIYSLGHNNMRWLDIFSINAPVHGSDINLKTDITQSSLGLSFINKLKPIQYRWKDNGKRLHFGFISQEVRDVLGHTENLNDYGMYVYSPETKREVDGEIISEPESYSLRYSEFISPMVRSIQELTERLEDLENNQQVQGDTIVMNSTMPLQSSSGSNQKIEKKLDELIGRVFSLENKNNDVEDSDGSPNINELLQQRIHQLEILTQKQEKKLKTLSTALNKLIKSL